MSSTRHRTASAPGLVEIAERLRNRTRSLNFAPPVACVYSPLDYAWAPHRLYLERYGVQPREVLFVGMNPGPFGMAQTGVPFGDVAMVRDWLGIEAPVERPAREHPKRLVRGFDIGRGEVSGARFWSWARERFRTPEKFFGRAFVWNYCPLAFVGATGRNITPDTLPRSERDPLFAVCDEALTAVVAHLRCTLVVGIGQFAARRAAPIAEASGVRCGAAPHPSPASPAANRGWPGIFDDALRDLGFRVPVPLPAAPPTGEPGSGSRAVTDRRERRSARGRARRNPSSD